MLSDCELNSRRATAMSAATISPNRRLRGLRSITSNNRSSSIGRNHNVSNKGGQSDSLIPHARAAGDKDQACLSEEPDATTVRVIMIEETWQPDRCTPCDRLDKHDRAHQSPDLQLSADRYRSSPRLEKAVRQSREAFAY